MITNLAAFFTNCPTPSHNNPLEQFMNNTHICILGHGLRQEGTSFQTKENFILSNFLLVYYEQGCVKLEHSGKTTLLKPGSFYIFNPFESFSGQRIGSGPIVYKYIYFDILPISSRSIFKKYAFYSGDKYFQQKWFRTTGIKLLEDAYQAAGQDVAGWIFLVQYAVRGIVAYIMQSRILQMPADLSSSSEKVTALVDNTFLYVTDHIQEPIDIAKLIKEIGTSRSTLNRAVFQVMQTSPVQAITKYKMNQALALLQDGQAVKEVAAAMGYSSAFHFSNTFKKVFAKSPREYLKR